MQTARTPAGSLGVGGGVGSHLAWSESRVVQGPASLQRRNEEVTVLNLGNRLPQSGTSGRYDFWGERPLPGRGGGCGVLGVSPAGGGDGPAPPGCDSRWADRHLSLPRRRAWSPPSGDQPKRSSPGSVPAGTNHLQVRQPRQPVPLGLGLGAVHPGRTRACLGSKGQRPDHVQSRAVVVKGPPKGRGSQEGLPRPGPPQPQAGWEQRKGGPGGGPGWGARPGPFRSAFIPERASEKRRPRSGPSLGY